MISALQFVWRRCKSDYVLIGTVCLKKVAILDTPIGYTNAKLVLYPGLKGNKQFQEKKIQWCHLLMLDNIDMDK